MITTTSSIESDAEILIYFAQRNNIDALKRIHERKVNYWLKTAHTICIMYWNVCEEAVKYGHIDIVFWISCMSISYLDAEKICYVDGFPSTRTNVTHLFVPKNSMAFDSAKRNGNASQWLIDYVTNNQIVH